MDKLKPSFILIGIGVVIGVIVGWVLFVFLDAKPTKVSIGPIEFEMPTATTTTGPQPAAQPTATVQPGVQQPNLTNTPQPTVPTVRLSPTAGVSEWYVPQGWSDHTEYASCPGYPSIQKLGFVSPGIVELTPEAAVVSENWMEWCFTIRFTRLAAWVKYYQDHYPSVFGTTEPESLAVYFRRLPAGMRVEVEGVGQVLPANLGQDGVSLKNSPSTFHVFMPVGMPTYQFESGPYLPGEPAVVIP